MTNKEILQKAIEKALKNSYQLDKGLLNQNYESIAEMCEYYKDGYLIADTVDGCESYLYSIRDIIFSHEFAKTFWGLRKIRISLYDNGIIKKTNDECSLIETWKYHLQQMILEKEPLKYIERFL